MSYDLLTGALLAYGGESCTWLEVELGTELSEGSFLSSLGFCQDIGGWGPRYWWHRSPTEVVRGAAAFMRALGESLCDADDVFSHHGMADFRGFWSLLVELTAAEQIKLIKYWTVWPMAKWLRQPLPRQPAFYPRKFPLISESQLPLPIAGHARCHLRNLLLSRTSSRRAAKVMVAMLQGTKRGCAPAPADFIVDAMRDHLQAMTQEIVLSDEAASNYRVLFQDLWMRHEEPRPKTFQATVIGDDGTEERCSIRPTGRSKQLPWVRRLGNPGTNACWEARRSDGGKAGYLHDLNRQTDGTWDAIELPDDPDTLEGICRKVVTKAAEQALGDPFLMSHLASFVGEPATTGVLNLVGHEPPMPGDEEDWRLSLDARIAPSGLLLMIETEPGVVRPVYGEPAASYPVVLRAAERWLRAQGIWQSAWGARALHGRCYAEVAPVLEPLKCRLISKGPALPYWAASAWQRKLWEHLRRLPCLSLIGRPVDGSDLEGILEREKALGLDLPDWVSGDYAAATDGLSSSINRLCLDEALEAFGATPTERVVMEAVLGPHYLRYPKKFRLIAEAQRMAAEEDDPIWDRPDIDRRFHRMSNGQLMGSPLSFPVLCAINLACYRRSLERYLGRSVPWEELPVLVNGDDILFRADDRLYAIWQEEIALAGFNLSLGKNYKCPNLLTVNSQFWIWRPARRYFEEVGYLNTGLLLSEAAVKPAIRTEYQDACWVEKANWCLAQCENPERTQRRLRHYYRAAIARDTANGESNLHLAPELGGLGLALRGATPYVTAFQSKLAWWLRSLFMALTGPTRLSRAAPFVRVGPRRERSGAVASLPQRDRTVDLVVRDSDEPRRENELFLSELEGHRALRSEQIPAPVDVGTWTFRWLSDRAMRAFRDALPVNPGYHGPGLYTFRPQLRGLAWSGLDPLEPIHI